MKLVAKEDVLSPSIGVGEGKNLFSSTAFRSSHLISVCLTMERYAEIRIMGAFELYDPLLLCLVFLA